MLLLLTAYVWEIKLIPINASFVSGGENKLGNWRKGKKSGRSTKGNKKKQQSFVTNARKIRKLLH